MQVTGRYWAGVALAGVLAAAALAFARPLLLAGAAGVGAWLLVQQFRFVRTVVRLAEDLSVTQSLARSRVVVDDETTVVLEATLPTDAAPEAVRIDVEASPPVGAAATSGATPGFTLTPDGSEATTAFAVRWPVAGEFRFRPPTVTVRDDLGLFRSSFASAGASTPGDTRSPTVTVVPRRPRTLHVGEGGDRTTAFGEHKTGEFGPGIDPGEVREYVPGDALRQIDWKATARSKTPHVRESEEETDHRTVLVVDHRASMGDGPAGETKLDFARQVALGFVEYARANREPIGLYAVGDDGVTTRSPPDSDSKTYATVETTLHDLTSTDASLANARDASELANDGTASPTTPDVARQTADRLRTDASAFGRNLHPFFGAARTYVRRVESDPLYHAVRAYLPRTRGTTTAVVLTDDRNRAEVREAVKLARAHSGTVLAFLTPTVLFEAGGLAELDEAYARYADFEDFRRDLARLDGVSAFEVAPGERLDALLATTATGRTAGQGEAGP